MEINILNLGLFETRAQKLDNEKGYWSICFNDRGEYKRMARTSERAQLSLKNLLDNLNGSIVTGKQIQIGRAHV